MTNDNLTKIIERMEKLEKAVFGLMEEKIKSPSKKSGGSRY